MKANRDIKPISYVKAHAAEILSQVNKTKEPLYVTQNGEAKAVIIDTGSYEALRETLSLLKMLSIGETNIKKGKVKSQADFFDEIENQVLK